jgi:hypothetical protein
MKKRNKRSTHENPQKMSSKKQNSRQVCDKKKSPNHPEKRDVSRKTKYVQYKTTFANSS